MNPQSSSSPLTSSSKSFPWPFIFMAFVIGTIFGWFSHVTFLTDSKPAASDIKKVSLSKGEKTVRKQVQAKSRAMSKSSKTEEAKVSPSESNPETTPSSPKAFSKNLPQTAKEVIDRLLYEIENTDSPEIDLSRVMGRLQQLRDFGEDGSQAIQEFLRSQQDIAIGQNNLFGGRQTQYPTLRAALLDTLYFMNDPISTATSLEILQTSASGYEALLATKNLEKQVPGKYRSEALKAVSEILTTISNDPASKNQGQQVFLNNQMLELVGYYQAKELIPQVEELIKKQPGMMLSSWLNALAQFPIEDQVKSFQKLLGDEKTIKTVLQNGGQYYLGRMDFQDNNARQLVRDVFSKNLNENQKSQLLQQISSSGYGVGFYQVMKTGSSPVPQVPSKSRIEGSLRLLDDLAPQVNTPDLQKKLEGTRKQLQQQLQNIGQQSLQNTGSFTNTVGR